MSFIGFAQDNGASDVVTPSQWEINISPYAWFTGQRAEISYTDEFILIDNRFENVLKDIKPGAQLHVELKHGKWFLQGDLLYFETRKEGWAEQLEKKAQLRSEQLVGEILGGYNLLNMENWLFLDALAGIRYFELKSAIEIESSAVLDETINATDPVVGLRVRTETEKWINSIRIDIGGFGIGSEISWKTNLWVGYKFTKVTSVFLGLQAYNINYEKENLDLYLFTTGVVCGVNFHI